MQLNQSNYLKTSREPVYLNAQGAYSELTVIIPTLNEASVIGFLLDDLAKRYSGATVLVVDDVSSDGTQQVVLERVSVLGSGGGCCSVELLERRGALVRGICASVIDAIYCCKTKFFLVMDGDFQHPPSEVAKLFSKLIDGADLVVANRLSRYFGHSVLRSIISRIATALARVSLRRRGIVVSDPMSGFFGGKTSFVVGILKTSSVNFELRGYKILFDILRFFPPNASIAHVHYRFGCREVGKSKLGVRHAVCFVRSLVKDISAGKKNS